MYFSQARPCHSPADTRAPAFRRRGARWFLAEGATGSFFDTYILVGNPSTTESLIQVTYLLPDGRTVVRPHAVAAQSRLTIYAASEDPLLRATSFSVVVESTNAVPVVVERAMWWPSGQPWYEGHAVAALTTAGPRWALPRIESDPATATSRSCSWPTRRRRLSR